MASDNPILNNPHQEPRSHYATNLDGELDYGSSTDNFQKIDMGKFKVTTPAQVLNVTNFYTYDTLAV